MRILVVGSGISGIATAAMLQRFGHEVVVLERSAKIGGVWAQAYPQVRLQNLWFHYHLADFPWPERPDDHPTATQILDYLEAAVRHLKLDIRLRSELVSLRHRGEGQGWTAEVLDHGAQGNKTQEDFDYTVLAVGQYTQPKAASGLSGLEDFHGELLTERDIDELSRLRGERVAVVGFGKSAVDMATFAVAHGARVEHVFRRARWLIPSVIGGLLHYTFALFTRFGSVMLPSWVQPTAGQRFFHDKFAWLVRGFWGAIGAVVRRQYRVAAWGKGAPARARIEAVLPPHSLISDMRSASALMPQDYYPAVARGDITPHRGELSHLDRDGLVLADGTAIACDVVLTCIGSRSPVFPFLSSEHRALLESEDDGVQLYRHLIHPDIPDLAFAGYNHGFMHVPSAEIGAVWIAALIAGELELPTREQMQQSIEYIRAWKREHINFEPSRSCAVNTRFQQYNDLLLAELELEVRRKSSPLSEQFARYAASDYAGMADEYQRKAAQRTGPLRVDPSVHT